MTEPLRGNWMDCMCEDDRHAGPCAVHDVARWPRYAAAYAAGDPFVDRDQWPGADEIAEFGPFRTAPSPAARQCFDEVWALSMEYAEDFGGACEDALGIRDGWPALVPAAERDALRRVIAAACADGEYPLRPTGQEPDEVLYGGPAAPERLRAEADQLARLAQSALDLETLIRQHLQQTDRPRP